MAETAERRRPKPWWRRSEFWVTVAAAGTAAAGLLPAGPGGFVAAVAVVAYTISRGIAKHGTGD